MVVVHSRLFQFERETEALPNGECGQDAQQLQLWERQTATMKVVEDGIYDGPII